MFARLTMEVLVFVEMGSVTWLQARTGFNAMEASIREQHLGTL